MPPQLSKHLPAHPTVKPEHTTAEDVFNDRNKKVQRRRPRRSSTAAQGRLNRRTHPMARDACIQAHNVDSNHQRVLWQWFASPFPLLNNPKEMCRVFYKRRKLVHNWL